MLFLTNGTLLASRCFTAIFQARCSGEVHSFVPAVQTFTVKNLPYHENRSNPSAFPLYSLVKSSCHSNSVFLRTVTMWNDLSRGCFPDYDRLNLFKSWIKHYLSYCSEIREQTFSAPHILVDKQVSRAERKLSNKVFQWSHLSVVSESDAPSSERLGFIIALRKITVQDLSL